MNVAELGLVRQGGENVLVCPACGGDCIHQIETVVVMRKRESEAEPLRVHVDRAGISTAFASEKATRRDVTRIRFRCEDCPHLSCLEVVQHKGQTFVSMTQETK